MKATELRIGNKFRWKSTGTVDKVKSIVTVGNKTYINDVNISDCEPVNKPNKRLSAQCRRFRFNFVRSIGILWVIDKMPGLYIKEPWGMMYERSKKRQICKENK